MKFALTAALAASVIAVGAAQAQTAAPSTTGNPPAAPTATPPAAPTATPPMGGTMGAPAAAGPSTSSAPAAVTTSNAPSRTTAAPVPGANSFTEGEARNAISKHGYTQVAGLKKDDKGIWRGTAMKDGHSVNVALDYQGNVVTQ